MARISLFLPTGGMSNVAGCLVHTTPTKMTFDLEGLQSRCKQLQEELDSTRRSNSQGREEVQLQMSKLEASLTAERKTNVELQVCVCCFVF